MWISGEAQLNNPQDLTGSTAFLDCATHGRCASATLTATQRKLTGFDSQPSRQVSWCEHSFNAQVEFIRWITAKLQVFWDFFVFFEKSSVFFSQQLQDAPWCFGNGEELGFGRKNEHMFRLCRSVDKLC